VVGVAVLTLAGVALGQARQERPANAGTVAMAPDVEPTDDSDPFLMSILSDSHAFNADSWWRQTIATGRFPGAYLGAFESQPGAATTSLEPKLDAATSKGGAVVVQAGTNDLLSKRTPEQAVEGLEALWQGVRDRGAVPVAALVPPSNEVPAGVVELNEQIRAAADEQGLQLIDVYSPVAQPSGQWANGLTTDARHANAAGSKLMAAAAREQLPAIIDALDG
jgi:lysophospholipase L1-like esterase